METLTKEQYQALFKLDYWEIENLEYSLLDTYSNEQDINWMEEAQNHIDLLYKEAGF